MRQERKAEAGQLMEQARQQYQTRQFQAALQSWQQALTIYRQIDDKEGEEAAIHNLGFVYYDLGQYGQALKYSQQALVMAQEGSDKVGEEAILSNLGAVYQALGQYSNALKSYQQALVIAQEIDNKVEEGKALNNLGFIYRALGQYSDALKSYQQALVIAQEIDNKAIEGTILNNIGVVYNALGQYPDALKSYQQALAIDREVDNKAGEGATLSSIGEVYRALEQYGQALKYSQQALIIAQEMDNKVEEGVALNNLGGVYQDLGQYPDALKYFQQALAIVQEVDNKAGEGTTLNNLGEVYLRLEQYAEAEETLFAAIEVLEFLRPGLIDADKISIFETQADTYLKLQLALIAQNKTDTALEITERGRARAFVELLASRRSENLNKQLTIDPPTIEQIQYIAREQNSTLVEYSVLGNQALYIWVVQPTGEVAFKSVDFESLNTNLAEAFDNHPGENATTAQGLAPEDTFLTEYVRGTREAIGVTRQGAPEATTTPSCQGEQCLQQMHQLLIEPIADLLPTNPDERVIFIPHQSLFGVPFPALQDETGKYLIEKHAILTAPAIQVLELTRQQRQQVSGTEMLVVGNPTMPSFPTQIGESPQQLSSLPYAEAEAIAIAQMFNTQPLIGNQATETAIAQQMPSARIVHLATHGLLDEVPGLDVPGAIALAPSSKDDGLLTAGEIFEMDLSAELVVLSACDTGRGDITGDGVVGLSRSLISAGVPSAIVSLWKVPDDSTTALMKEFYQNLQQNPDKAQALQSAMLTTMKQYPHPINWAAFTLIGEAK